jgi:hypothetical protein
MDRDLLKNIAEQYLVPFFPGARLQPDVLTSSQKDELVALKGPCAIAFKIEPEDDYRLVLTRSQPFATPAENVVPEITVVRSFVSALQPMVPVLDCLPPVRAALLG